MSTRHPALPTPATTPEPVAWPVDLSPVRAAVAGVRRAEEGVRRARAAVDAARSAVTDALLAATRPIRDGDVPVPDGLVAELYWEWDDVRVGDIARAVGLPGKEVAARAGRRVVTGPCRRCGGPAEAERRTRQAHVSFTCDGCVEAERREAEDERRQLEVREALRDLVAEWEREGQLPYRYDGRW